MSAASQVHCCTQHPSLTMASTMVQRVYRGYLVRKRLWLVSLYTKLRKSEEPVVDGYGEYLVYLRDGSEIPKELYDLAYDAIHGPIPDKEDRPTYTRSSGKLDTWASAKTPAVERSLKG